MKCIYSLFKCIPNADNEKNKNVVIKYKYKFKKIKTNDATLILIITIYYQKKNVKKQIHKNL